MSEITCLLFYKVVYLTNSLIKHYLNNTNMKTLQLFKDGKQILASDGIMYVDGRFNASSIKQAVIERNTRYAKNFPHKLADGFATYSGRIGSQLSSIHSI